MDDYEQPDTEGFVYTVTVDGEPALADLLDYVPFCDGRKSADFDDFKMAVSAAQGLRNALGTCTVGITIKHTD